MKLKGTSGDQNGNVDVNHLSGRQLQARALATVYSSTGVFNLGENVDEKEDEVPHSPLPKRQKQNKMQRHWVKSKDLVCNFESFVSPDTNNHTF